MFAECNVFASELIGRGAQRMACCTGIEALQANQWNRRKTAQALKISYRALIYKIRNAGLHARDVENLTPRRENT